MRIRILAIGLIILIAAGVLAASSLPAFAGTSAKTGGNPKEQTYGNCLSFPVIWAEGVTKVLRGDPEETPILKGHWWYWWGTDDLGNPLSCHPDPNNETFCDDLNTTTYNDSYLPGDGYYKAYLQQDKDNTWQASSTDADKRVQVDMIDWGDNLESVNWYTNSKVRTEVVLLEDSNVSQNDIIEEPLPMLQYEMRHLYGLGINEMWGISTVGETHEAEEVDPNTQATVYSHCARLTIQKLLIDRTSEKLNDLIWVPEKGWTEPADYSEPDLINEPIFNKPVWELGNGPSYFSAEINVKGKVMYGYNWDLNKVYDLTPVSNPSAAGDYRVTFSFDDNCGLNGPSLNTFFTDANGDPVTQIMEELAEDTVTLSTTESDDSDGGNIGSKAVIDYNNNLTYMDIRILEKGG